MLTGLHNVIQWVRSYGQWFFLHYGMHCATHQIRVILISSVVITSLFYPALASYYSSPYSSLAVFTNFAKTYSDVPNHHDLADLWSGSNLLRIRDDRLSKLSCASGRSLRVERLLLQSSSEDDDSVLNRPILLRALKFQKSLGETIRAKELPCLKGHDDHCLFLSPLAFWDHDTEAVMSDTSIPDTLALGKNVSVSGLLVTPSMVLAGRSSLDHSVSSTSLDYATYLVFTYFFESNCLDSAAHETWVDVVHQAASSTVEVKVFPEQPSLVALEYQMQPEGWTALSVLLALAYFGFFVYVLWTMRRMNAVHSRVGVTFTALVEIAVSTVTSLSLLLLVGFKITLVPWELLPIVIMFVGAENMSNLVDAVAATSVTISVKDRIAQGLSRAGTSNSLKLVSYNTILGIIGAFSAGAIQQFCVFAIVVLVAHWFLAHTFFVTVLSIDLARLELDELLRQDVGSTSVPSPPSREIKRPHAPTMSRKDRMIQGAKTVIKGRAAKNISLVLLLTITATLYYSTYPTNLQLASSTNTSPHHHSPQGALAQSRIRNTTSIGVEQPLEKQLWSIFNPHDETPFHLRIEAPVLLTLHENPSDAPVPSPDTKEHQKSRQHRFYIRTIRRMWWFFKIMALPIGLTTLALWILTIYLLKDTDRLEAQKNRPAAGEPDTIDAEQSLEGKLSFYATARAYPSDVELVASSKSGSVIVSVGLLNELAVHWTKSDIFAIVQTNPVVQRSASCSAASSTLVAVAVDQDGAFCAVGTGDGVVGLWSITDKAVNFLTVFTLEDCSAGVSQLHFLPPGPSTPPKTVLSDVQSPPPMLVAAYENGSVVRYSHDQRLFIRPVSYSGLGLLKAALLPVGDADGQLVAAFIFEDGMVDLVDPATSSPIASLLVSPESDRLSQLHVCQAVDHGQAGLIIATTSERGVVSMWDVQTGSLIVSLDGLYPRASRLRAFPDATSSCNVCGQRLPDAYTVAICSGGVLQVFTVFAPRDDLTRQCSCLHTRPKPMPSGGRRSRSGSITSNGSPIMLRKKPSLTFEAPSFPISGHGLHSRRGSEKDGSRRVSDALGLFSSDDDPRRLSSESTGAPAAKRGTSAWLMEVDVQRGNWDAGPGYLLGVRRATRAGQPTSSHSKAKWFRGGLSLATLDRWEAWKFDSSKDTFSSSALASLYTPASSRTKSPPQETVPRLPFTRVTPFIAHRSHIVSGFGNTIGVIRNI